MFWLIGGLGYVRFEGLRLNFIGLLILFFLFPLTRGKEGMWIAMSSFLCYMTTELIVEVGCVFAPLEFYLPEWESSYFILLTWQTAYTFSRPTWYQNDQCEISPKVGCGRSNICVKVDGYLYTVLIALAVSPNRRGLAFLGGFSTTTSLCWRSCPCLFDFCGH